MAKNIDFMGAVFPDVPSVKLPQQGGGLVAFDDTTDATATADKILQGYTAYANGQKLVGTASGGITPSGTISITQNGTVDVTQYASADVNVSGGGGGLEYETGTWTPTASTPRGQVLFQNQHTSAPSIILMASLGGSWSNNYLTSFYYIDYYKLFGDGITTSSSGIAYAMASATRYYGSGLQDVMGLYIPNSSDSTEDSTQDYPRYYATETMFCPCYGSNTSNKFRAGRTYSWIAIWK